MKRFSLAIATFATASAMAGMVSSPVPWKGEDAANYGISARFGVLEGMTHEYVYGAVPSIGYKGTLSRLDWKIKNVTVGGLEAGARWGRFTVNGGAWTSCNKGGGNVMDYDWMEIPEMAEDEGFSYSETYSDTDLEEFYAFDFNVGYDLLRLDNGLSASAFAGLRYESWRWGGFGLTGEYGYPEDGEMEPQFEDPDVKIFTYEQEYFYGYVGARAGWTIGCFDLNAYVAWAPGYHAKDKDNHHLREVIFFSDNNYDSYMMLYGVSVSAALSDSLTVSLAWEAVHSGVAKTSGSQIGNDEEDDDDDLFPDAKSWSGIKMRNHLFSAAIAYTF